MTVTNNKQKNDIEIGRNAIRLALSNYRSQEKSREVGIYLVKTVRNGIEVINGITAEDLYNDTIAFSKLVRLAETV